MKSILKILVLGVVPILAATAVVDQGLASGKGSQLIFQADVADKNFISVTNTGSKKAVTVLTQYYNDEMTLVLWYLRVITSESTVLVDPFDHEIPGTAKTDKDGKEMPGTATNVSEVLGALPAMTNKDDGAGVNSGRMVIAITAVGANTVDDASTADVDEDNEAPTVNILFPDFLASGMHKTDNIDNCGQHVYAADTSAVAYTAQGAEGADDCKKGTDVTSKNVGKLTRDNAAAIAFNHLSGHFTSAMVQTAAGGSDQTASWGGNAVTRGAVDNTANTNMIARDYVTLTGANGTDATNATGAVGGRLAEIDAGGAEHLDSNTVSGYTGDKGTNNEAKATRGLNGGSLTLPALHGGGAETHQVIQLLSVSENFGAGKYMLIPAKTAYKVTLTDNMGNALPDPAAEAGPIYGGVDDPKTPPGVSIIVDGIQVMMNANFAKCTGDAITGDWSVAELVSIVPTAASGKDDFAGLDATLMPAMNASPGWAVFTRPTDDDNNDALICKKDHGDGDDADGADDEVADNVPIKDERSYTAGTLVVEAAAAAAYPDRAYVTTGQVVLKFVTAESTFAASWSLNAPASPAN